MTTLYFPLVMSTTLSELGVQIEGSVSAIRQWIVPERVYQILIRWDNFNQNQSQYDVDVATIRDRGGRVAIGVKCVPAEHRLWPEYLGSPPKPTSYNALAEWVIYVCNRYHPEYVELFNEPNVGRDAAKYYGCQFGAWMIDGEDVQLSGRRYGSMLRAVYPKLKEVQAIVYAGALMINNYWESFLQGMGDAPADAISWHHYLRMGVDFHSLDDTISKFRAITSNVLAITETSILDENDSFELQQRQAEWYKYLQSALVQYDLKSVAWYTLSGNDWLNSDLVHNGNPDTPAYKLFCGEQ